MKREGSLLFLSPTMPGTTGHGSAIRSGAVLEALAERFRVSLLVLQLSAGRRYTGDPGVLQQWCEQIAVRSRGDGSNHPQALFQGTRFDAIHAYRLPMAAVALAWRDAQRGHAVCALDLDDYESKAKWRFAGLYASAGRAAEAKAMRETADKFELLEDYFLPMFDGVFVANDLDRVELAERFPANTIRLLPNVVRLPQPARAKRTGGDAFTFLLVASMRYIPNQDAALFFSTEVIPMIRKSAPGPFRLLVVGADPPDEVQALGAIPEVEVIGEVQNIASVYRQADAAVVPLRAGGGTRIKILEAAGFHVPIVTTAIGADGLDVVHGREVLIGNTAAEFAACCLRLMHEPAKRRRLANRAYAWVSSHHTTAQLWTCLREVYER